MSSNTATSVGGKKKTRPTQKEFDQAFDELAHFLFEQYLKHKEKEEGAS